MFFKKLKLRRSPSAEDGALTLRQALVYLLWFGLPTAISFTSSSLSNIIAFSFVGGHDSEDVQAAHGLGYSIGNMLVLTVGYGLVNGMDTLCPLVIGAGHPEGCWAHLFQALLVSVVVLPILAPMIVFSEHLLIFAKQDPTVAHLASQYLLVSFPGLFFLSTFEAGRKFLVYHRYTAVHTVIAVISIPVQALFLYIFVDHLDLGATGAGIARSFTWFVISGSVYSYIFIRRRDFAWDVYLQPLAQRVEQSFCPRITSAETTTGDSHDVAPTSPTQQEHHQPSSSRFASDPEKSAPEEVSRQRMTTSSSGTLPQQQDLHTSSHARIADDGATTERVDAHARCGSPTRASQRASVLNTCDDDHVAVGTAKRAEVPDTQPSSQLEQCRGGYSSSAKHNTSFPFDPRTQTTLTRVTESHNNSRHRPFIQQHDRWWKGIPYFLRIAIPSTFLCVFEWIAFEVQIFMAAYLGSVELSALASTSSLGALLYYVSLSIAVTLNGDIGRAMGARKPKDGFTLAKSGLLAAVSVSVPLAAGVLLLRPWIARMYSKASDIEAAVYRNLLPLAFIVIFDSFHAILAGELKALALQWYGVIFDALCLLGVMQAVGILLAYHTQLQGEGFLIGTLSGLTLNTMGYIILLFWVTNWEKKSVALAGAKRSEAVPGPDIADPPPLPALIDDPKERRQHDDHPARANDA